MGAKESLKSALGLVLAGAAGWAQEAGGGEVRVSNQSLRQTITVTQLVERGGPDDTCVVLLTDPDDRCPGSSRDLKPGATARIFLRR